MGQLKCGEIQTQPNLFNMQCNQPFWYTGFQNNAQYPTFPSYQTQSPYPEVIGEGDVITTTLPDGRVQCYFVPVNRRDQWVPCNANPTIHNSVPVWANGNTAWFVRSVVNPYSTVESFSSVPNNLGSSHVPSYTNINSGCQGYVQKFHNDSCTSTTELHYFDPHLRSTWLTNCCAGVQVEIPKQEKTILHYGTICSRPCYCCTQCDKTEQSSESPMNVDEVKSTLCCCNKDKNRSNDNITKKNIYVCRDCRSQSLVNTSDKAVTTYADRATSCTRKKGCKSQTDIETGMWFKKRQSKNIERSNRSLDTCNSSCCLDSTCCCNSDQTINK